MGLRSQWPDALLLVLIAFAVVASLTAIGALLATALFVVPAATVRLWTQRLPVWQLALGGARGRPGHRRPLALGRAEHAAGADRRGARRRALRGVARSWQPLAAALRGRAALAGAGARCSRCVRRRAAAAARSQRLAAPTSSRRRRSSATGRARSAATRRDVHQILQPNTDPHEYEPRPADVQAVAGRGSSCSRAATGSTPGWAP